MKNVSVFMARSFAFIDLSLIDPKGRVFWPDLIKELAKEFSFQKSPQPSELEEKKGLEFRLGKTRDVVIDALKLFDTLVVVETHSNTSDSEEVLDELLQWANGKFALTYTSNMIRGRGYVSDVFFETDFPLLDEVCKPLTTLGAKTSAAMANIWHEQLEYRPIHLSVGHDPLIKKNGIAPFSIQLRTESHISDNRWFSEAPLPTDLHIKLLEEFEADVLALKKV
jgi:hypothetical protein